MVTAQGKVDPAAGSGATISPGTPIALDQLFTTTGATTFNVTVRTAGGGYLIDPNGNHFTDGASHAGWISQLGQWKFVASGTTDREDLIGLDAIGAGATSSAASVVYTGNRIVQGIDTQATIDAADAMAVKQAGYQFVVQYYDSDGVNTVFDANERMILANAGLQICTVFENKSSIGNYSGGANDARSAIAEAKAAGQNAGSAIYFAIDDDYTGADVLSYFQTIASVFADARTNTLGYKVGIYGSGFNLQRVKAAGYADYGWLATSSYGWTGTKDYNDWNMSQPAVTNGFNQSNLDPNASIIVPGSNGLYVDVDLANGDIGAFGAPSGNAVSWKLYETPAKSQLDGTYQTFASALAAAISGNDIVMVDPGGIGADLGAARIDVNNLTVEGGVGLKASFLLDAGVARFAVDGATNAKVTGNTAANTITGSSGINLINGGAGADVMTGRGGNDVYYVDNAGDRVIEGSGGGTDAVRSAVSYKLTTGQQIELLSTTDAAGIAALHLIGNTFANKIVGNAGNNVLDGGGGKDMLMGGGGRDIFLFDSALSASTNFGYVNDFTNTGGTPHDVIELAHSIFTGLTPGALDPNAFKDLGVGGEDSSDRILNKGGVLYYDADGKGGAGAIGFARLDGSPTLSASDFKVV